MSKIVKEIPVDAGSDSNDSSSDESSHIPIKKPANIVKRQKKGKVFTTKSGMLDILDQVNKTEESRLEIKMNRQKRIKKLVEEKGRKANDRKVKRNKKLDDMKAKLTKKEQQKRKDRKSSNIKKKAADNEKNSGSSPKKQKKSVSFAC